MWSPERVDHLLYCRRGKTIMRKDEQKGESIRDLHPVPYLDGTYNEFKCHGFLLAQSLPTQTFTDPHIDGALVQKADSPSLFVRECISRRPFNIL
jgi:hypothetical protein